MKHEREIRVAAGMPMLLLNLALFIASGLIIYQMSEGEPSALQGWGVTLTMLAAILMMSGFFVVEPNGSKVLLLFGRYVGTVKKTGFHWSNPFMTKRPLSLRVRTLNGEKLKVNDSSGNPIEIAAIIVWQVVDTYEASFEVDDYIDYVSLQSETAVRHAASTYPYDDADEAISLRRNTEEVSEHLREQLQERLKLAGVRVIEARLSHLAYAQEIAGAMLRRQQATAIIAAREKIVDGAVSMVEMALLRMEKEGVIELDEERKAAMVSNLMVVLCSDHAAQPVLNTGSLY